MDGFYIFIIIFIGFVFLGFGIIKYVKYKKLKDANFVDGGYGKVNNFKIDLRYFGNESEFGIEYYVTCYINGVLYNNKTAERLLTNPAFTRRGAKKIVNHNMPMKYILINGNPSIYIFMKKKK